WAGPGIPAARLCRFGRNHCFPRVGGETGPAAGHYFCSERGRGAEVAAAEQEKGVFHGCGGGSSEGGAAWCRRLCPPFSYHPRVPEWDGASRSARLARAVRRHGGGGDGGTRAPRFCSAGSGRIEAAGRRAVRAAGTMSADEEELKVPEEMFKDVKFFTVGDIDPKVIQLLKAGKAKEVSYNALASHIISEDGDHPEVGESREVFDLPVVKPSWVILSVRCGALLPYPLS
uniref:PAX transactivation activation domain-interacting protein n=1 Tax=Pavo cristatus TaxID=9049 RepID=A0A8C9F5N1_PAVCR